LQVSTVKRRKLCDIKTPPLDKATSDNDLCSLHADDDNSDDDDDDDDLCSEMTDVSQVKCHVITFLSVCLFFGLCSTSSCFFDTVA